MLGNAEIRHSLSPLERVCPSAAKTQDKWLISTSTEQGSITEHNPVNQWRTLRAGKGCVHATQFLLQSIPNAFCLPSVLRWISHVNLKGMK